MNTKLTLNLSKSTIEVAKSYAKENEISLSKLIENYLNSIIVSSPTKKKISPLVESLTGVIPDDIRDERRDYRDYINKKYM